MRDSPPRWPGLLLTAAFAACFDPLYEDTSAWEPTAPRYSVCCTAGRVDTCPCSPNQSCEYGFRACAEGRCVELPATGPAPACRAVSLDAGSEGDAGVSGDGGPPGGVHDGGAGEPTFVPCCQMGRVGTCPCFGASCPGTPFTPCAHGTCIEGTSSGTCA